jgi:hypothetical protein
VKLIVVGGLKMLKKWGWRIGVIGDGGILIFLLLEGLKVKASGHFDIQGLSKTLFIGWLVGDRGKSPEALSFLDKMQSIVKSVGGFLFSGILFIRSSFFHGLKRVEDPPPPINDHFDDKRVNNLNFFFEWIFDMSRVILKFNRSSWADESDWRRRKFVSKSSHEATRET